MAIAGRARCADISCESAKTRLPGLASFVRKTLTALAVSCALAVAGCARHSVERESVPVQHEVRAAPVRIHRHTERRQAAELRVHRPDPALLVSQPPPDCELKKTDTGSVDPDQWARLKLDYERQCYQNAEKAARDRLRLLQASSLCEIEPVQHKRPAAR